MAQTILIIDDEQVLRDTLTDRLVQEGYRVLQASDGPAGIQMAIDQQPDLILLDNRMPGLSGYQMLSQLRTHDNWGAHVPVVFFTNVQLTKDAEPDIAQLGVAAYIEKSSTTLDGIAEKIKEVLGS